MRASYSFTGRPNKDTVNITGVKAAVQAVWLAIFPAELAYLALYPGWVSVRPADEEAA